LSEDADVYRPSNGTEGELFSARMCGDCRHDEANGGDCDRVLRSMTYDVGHPAYPREWRRRFTAAGEDAWCTAREPGKTVPPRRKRVQHVDPRQLQLLRASQRDPG